LNNKIILHIKYIFIYYRFNLKLAKGQLARDEIPLDIYSAPLSPISLLLKIRKEKIQKLNKNLFKNNLKTKKKILKYLLGYIYIILIYLQQI
jgi:hypothetical protein